jgi:putative ABC transport system permease protein
MDKKRETPALANWLISKFVNEKLSEELLGDLEEMHEHRSSRSAAYANLMYWVDVLHLLIGFGVFKRSAKSNNLVMYTHYLTIAARNLNRAKVYSIINITSLAVGMGVCLTICQYVYFELSYDKFHGNYQNIYRVSIDEVKASGEPYPYLYETGYALGVAAKEETADVKQFARLHKYSGGAVITTPDKSKLFTEDATDILFTDNAFFQLFSFPFKQGNKESAFHDKYSIVLTEATAAKYFGGADPIGKTLTVSGGISPGEYLVTGVLELPANSHLQFGFLMPFENYIQLGWGGAATKDDNGWESPDCTTYMALDQSSGPDVVATKLEQLIDRHNGQRNRHEGITAKVKLQPVADIHLRSDQGVDQGLARNNGNIDDIRFFSIIAFFILLIPWINYINLSTARSMHRAKEVGIRKSIGAFRRQLITQFITESIVVNLIAALVSIGIAILILPVLNGIVGRQLDLDLLTTPLFWMALLGVTICGALLSGLYPAFILSSFKPVSMLKANKNAKAGSFSLRRGLITFQFLTSLLLISGTYLVYNQITFMKSQELGMDLEKVLVVKGPEVNLDRAVLESTLQSFREKVAQHHSIASVAASSSVPGKGYNTGLVIRKLGQSGSADQFGRVVFAGPGLPETYDLQFVAGKSPTTEIVSREVVVVINEEAVRTFGLGSPETAMQEKLYYKEDTFRVVGVVKDFHWHSLREAHTPYLFEFYPDCRSYLSFKINLSNLPESMKHIESTYNSFFPGNAFDYFFLVDEFNKQYQSDVRFGKLFFAFTILAIFIACIGLFALVSYSATLRVKEIGIRKTLGATVSNIMLLLSKEYLILLLVANVLAVPIIIYWGGLWLSNYAFRIGIGIGLFVLPGLALILVSFLTTGYRTYVVARTNPVESLRSE